MELASSAFSIGQTGEDQVNPTFGEKLPYPFVVRISKGGWIPCNALVFADSAEMAKARVMAALQEVSDRVPENWVGTDRYKYDSRGKRAREILQAIDLGALVMQVEPYDTKVIAKIAWAANDTVV